MRRFETAYLYIIALMVVAILSKQSVMDDMMNVKLVEKWIPVLFEMSASISTADFQLVIVSHEPLRPTQ